VYFTIPSSFALRKRQKQELTFETLSFIRALFAKAGPMTLNLENRTGTQRELGTRYSVTGTDEVKCAHRTPERRSSCLDCRLSINNDNEQRSVKVVNPLIDLALLYYRFSFLTSTHHSY
jgi:hypothetical protein